MGGFCFEGYCRFSPDTELEGGRNEERKLDEGDREAMGRNAIEEEDEEESACPCLVEK